jgi:hypothetical protein
MSLAKQHPATFEQASSHQRNQVPSSQKYGDIVQLQKLAKMDAS